MPFLAITNLKKVYDGKTILHDISIDVEEGEFLVLVGPSGCGKSTLLNMIAGLTEVDSGDIYLNDKRINDAHASERDIAMVFQSYALYPNMNVRQNLSFGLEMRKVAKSEREKLVNDVAEMLQITQLLDRKPAALSGGQRQRVAMGRALVRRPQVFLFDEPLSNLDAKLRVDMRTEIKRLHQRLGTTMVYVTHDQIEAMTLSTKIAVMNQGILQQLGKADEIYRMPKNIFVAQFMGSPSMNLIDAQIHSKAKTRTCVIDDVGDVMDIPFIDDLHIHQKTQAVKLGIRPENISIVNKKDTSCVEAFVELVEPAGADCYVILRLADKNITARLEGYSDVSAGENVYVQFDTQYSCIFDSENGNNLLLGE